ncbi:response regulator [uncultured Bacteroides sp.]|uniref:hybrid sensor histidine kinase/response regulator transcription factor n=1 Tax=uncultured Bacteroides sp. TaxID=162156 RepID=UPI00260DBA8D|nr:response regulator [uncultured Bacteroides sp.]
MDKIFDRFFQSKVGDRHSSFGQSGTGIGLFLCKRIIELHGGIIFARNNQRRGASFRILLPLLQAGHEISSANVDSDVKKETTQEGLAGSAHKETILVVEDNRDMRAYVCSLLSKNYRFLEAENGEEALRIVQKHSVDLIVSDLMMPVMDGMEFSRRIKDNLLTSHIPFLMLTAISSDVQEKKSFEIGVDEYICKPFDEEVFLLRIRNILNLRNRYKKRFSVSGNVSELHIKEGSRDQQFVNKAIELMGKHYADSEYNLECFVRDMGYSKTLVNNKMQALVGQPIGQFMKNYRLNVAHRMLQERRGDINVSEAAYAVGFNDPKYFTKCFKEFFGYLPSSGFKKD